MKKKNNRIASTTLFSIAATITTILGLILLFTYFALVGIASQPDETFGFVSAFLRGSQVATLTGSIIWGIFALVSFISIYRSWATKFGKSDRATIFAIIWLVIILVLMSYSLIM